MQYAPINIIKNKLKHVENLITQDKKQQEKNSLVH
jgi:hypothetical protein